MEICILVSCPVGVYMLSYKGEQVLSTEPECSICIYPLGGVEAAPSS